jgi:hypothetical protein
MNYGFGVDENTALLVSQADADGNTHLSVLGAGGVFIADLRAATASADLQRPFSIDGVRAHYLLPGDGARIDAAGGLHVKLSTVAPVLLPKDSQAFVRQDRLLGFGTTLHSNDRRSIQTAPYYSATLIRDHHTEFRGTSAPDENGVGRASYTGLLVQFSPCDGECSEPAVTPTKPK